MARMSFDVNNEKDVAGDTWLMLEMMRCPSTV
jgi:hypothetical protein